MKCHLLGRLVPVLLGLVTLSGCLLIPTPEVSEIRNSKLEFIEPGRTTRAELEVELLSDDVFVARVSRPYTIYAEHRRAPFSVLTQNYFEVMGDVDDYLVVEYGGDDTVVRYDRIRREGGCTDFGVCVRGGDEYSVDTLVVYGPTEADEALKQFDAIGGACSVYTYVDGPFTCNSSEVDVVNVNSGLAPNLETRVRVDGYLHWGIPVNDDDRASGTLVARRRDAYLARHQFECGEGDVVIIGLELSKCTIGVPRASFVEVNGESGELAVEDRRLILE